MASNKQNGTPKSGNGSAEAFWNSIPKTTVYENLKDWEGRVLRVVAVTDYIGEFSECYVLNGYEADNDIPFDAGEPGAEEEETKLHQVLVSKGYEGRDTVCNHIREYLASQGADGFLDVTVRKVKRFYAIEQPR